MGCGSCLHRRGDAVDPLVRARDAHAMPLSVEPVGDSRVGGADDDGLPACDDAPHDSLDACQFSARFGLLAAGAAACGPLDGVWQRVQFAHASSRTGTAVRRAPSPGAAATRAHERWPKLSARPSARRAAIERNASRSCGRRPGASKRACRSAPSCTPRTYHAYGRLHIATMIDIIVPRSSGQVRDIVLELPPTGPWVLASKVV